MDLKKSVLWMFFGSIIFGIYFNGMNILAYRVRDIYLSLTLFYSALWMASGMVIIEIIMYYFSMNNSDFPVVLFIAFILFSLIIAFIMRKQIGVNDNEWLKRMISHHSTALTTSHAIMEKTENIKVRNLAKQIIDTQEKEIKEMTDLLQKS